MNSKIIDIEANVHLSRTPSHRSALIKNFQTDKKKIAAFASLASILVLVTIANTSLLSRNETGSAQLGSQGRGIASISVENTRAATIEDARQVLRTIETQGARGPSSIGAIPSLVDQLRFGLLEGKYALRMSDGKLNELEFVDTAQITDRPKYLESSEGFLKEYKGLMPVAFDTISKPQERLEGERFSQVYFLKNASDQTVGEAHFVKDSVGRLLSFKFQNVE